MAADLKLFVHGPDNFSAGFALRAHDDTERDQGIAMLKAAQAGLDKAGYETRLVQVEQSELEI